VFLYFIYLLVLNSFKFNGIVRQGAPLNLVWLIYRGASTRCGICRHAAKKADALQSISIDPIVQINNESSLLRLVQISQTLQYMRHYMCQSMKLLLVITDKKHLFLDCSTVMSLDKNQSRKASNLQCHQSVVCILEYGQLIRF
jgi:hypothetical protein